MWIINLILIIIILIIILICSKCSIYSFSSNKQLLSDNQKEIIKFKKEINSIISLDLYNNQTNYRIGDIFYQCEDKTLWGTDEIKSYVKNYPNSIATKYLINSNYKQKKWDILINIINSKFILDKNINKSKVCLMHVRIGDIAELDKYCNKLCLFNKFKYNIKINNINYPHDYINSQFYYKNKILKLKKLKINELHIFCGSHILIINILLGIYMK